MSEFLSILTEEQRKSLTLDQCNSINKIKTTNLLKDIESFNQMLKQLYSNIEYCQHDSEYRLMDMKDLLMYKLIYKMNDFLKSRPNFSGEVFIYPFGCYLLDKYMYGTGFFSEKHYAAKNFYCVSKTEYFEYCKINNIDSKKFIVNIHTKQYDHNFGSKELIFTSYMEALNKHVLELPHSIELNDIEGDFPSRHDLICYFEFINIPALLNK
jgi:hypothetical protein